MKRNRRIILALVLVSALAGSAKAGLAVQVDEPKTTGGKAYVKLTMKNTFTNAVESARAAVFLLDANGKVVGQATRWVLGQSALPAGPSPIPGSPASTPKLTEGGPPPESPSPSRRNEAKPDNPQPFLAPDAERPFFFVVLLAKPVTGPLRSRVLFDRVILSGGALADVAKAVTLQPSGK